MPEFPSTHNVTTVTGTVLEDYTPGMSLRDWFAGQALAGMMSRPLTQDRLDFWAEVAYKMADAMMKARGD